MLPLCYTLSTFACFDLDVAQEYLPPLTQQLEEENEATSIRSLLSFCVSQRTMYYKTTGTGVKKLEYCYVTRNRHYLLDFEVLRHCLRSVPDYVRVPAVTISENVATNLSKIIYISLREEPSRGF